MNYLPWRRVIEIALVMLALPVASVLGLLIAAAISLESKGGALFVQTRPGKHGRAFRMVKFRTMTASQHEPFRLTVSQDARLTRVGRWMRATHLDEIPQLWHVLTGEMSLIGPRPVPMELYTHYRDKIFDYDARHAVVPGITGLAQVSLGYVNTLEGEREKWQFDVFYIAHRSPTLDAWILWATIANLLGIKIKMDCVLARVAAFDGNKNAP
ncbi:MAG: sugar transferase [Phycisphaerae bacterium]|nr:sugar transferase [Saprospiraceae bacterium]